MTCHMPTPNWSTNQFHPPKAWHSYQLTGDSAPLDKHSDPSSILLHPSAPFCHLTLCHPQWPPLSPTLDIDLASSMFILCPDTHPLRLVLKRSHCNPKASALAWGTARGWISVSTFPFAPRSPCASCWLPYVIKLKLLQDLKGKSETHALGSEAWPAPSEENMMTRSEYGSENECFPSARAVLFIHYFLPFNRLSLCECQ